MSEETQMERVAESLAHIEGSLKEIAMALRGLNEMSRIQQVLAQIANNTIARR